LFDVEVFVAGLVPGIYKMREKKMTLLALTAKMILDRKLKTRPEFQPLFQFQLIITD
jgi:hypothetical protein